MKPGGPLGAHRFFFFSHGFPYFRNLEASPKTPIIVLYSCLDGTARPIILLNITVVLALLSFGYSIASRRSPKYENIISFSLLSAGSDLLGSLCIAMKNS